MSIIGEEEAIGGNVTELIGQTLRLPMFAVAFAGEPEESRPEFCGVGTIDVNEGDITVLTGRRENIAPSWNRHHR